MAIGATVKGKLMDVYSEKNKKTGDTQFKAVVYQRSVKASQKIGVSPDTFQTLTSSIGEDVELDCEIGAFKTQQGSVMQFIKEVS